ncbi:MAG: polyphosphate polymerase domain-containing protein [Prevotella sp.]|nr:polyphosphate polymerase domain-containing protein [Prevotella sp.]
MILDRNIDKRLRLYETISLEQMKDVRLMNRIDTKFVTTRQRLLSLLEMAASDYYVQNVNEKLSSQYQTLYFDTPDFKMFYTHQAGYANRQKLRFRTYVDSNLSFLEVKTKNNHRRTKKKRMAVDDMELDDREKQDFAARHLRYDVTTLHPALENSFRRITLVNRQKTERLTIDVDLHFHNIDSDKVSDLHDIAVIELKRDGLSPSPVLQMLRQLRIHPHGFSKYCMGQTLTSDSLRINRFKEKLREINIIMKQ